MQPVLRITLVAHCNMSKKKPLGDYCEMKTTMDVPFLAVSQSDLPFHHIQWCLFCQRSFDMDMDPKVRIKAMRRKEMAHPIAQ